MRSTIRRALVGAFVPLLGMAACAMDMTSEDAETSSTELASADGTMSATLAVQNDWGSGYCADVLVKNTGSGSTSGWKVTLSVGNASIYNHWNADFAGTTGSVVVSSTGANGAIAHGATKGFGFCASGSARPSVASVTRNGAPGGTNDPPTAGPDAPSGYTFCANENQRCNFSGSGKVAYGADGTFAYRDATNGIDCNNATFGDPIRGTAKRCSVKLNAGGDTGGTGGTSGGFAPTSASCRLVLNEGFGEHPGAMTSFSQGDLEREWGNVSGPFKGLDDGRTKVGGSVIQGFFPKDTILGQETGFSWFSDLAGNPTEAIMEYRIKFDPGFDWSKGGKLPGLCGGNCPRGCTEDSTQGFSMRLMWRDNGRMITYPYWPERSESTRCGGEWRWSQGMDAGRWHTVRQHIKLNTPNQKNGIIEMYLDGRLVQREATVKFRTTSDVSISKAYITTYVGGSTPDWAPDHDQHIEFDSFKVWTGCFQ